MAMAAESSPPWADLGQWRQLNRLMAAWSAADEQGEARQCARQMAGAMAQADELMDALCAVTCPWCPAPCCIDARVWLDHADLAFIHLAGLEPPPAQLRDNVNQICRYLGPKGCSLPRTSRPWVCTWHLCPTMKNRLDQTPASRYEWLRLQEKIKKLRSLMSHELPRPSVMGNK